MMIPPPTRPTETATPTAPRYFQVQVGTILPLSAHASTLACTPILVLAGNDGAASIAVQNENTVAALIADANESGVAMKHMAGNKTAEISARVDGSSIAFKNGKEVLALMAGVEDEENENVGEVILRKTNGKFRAF